MGIRDRVKKRQSSKRNRWKNNKTKNKRLKNKFEKENWLVWHKGRLVKYNELEKIEIKESNEISGTEDINFELEFDKIIRYQKRELRKQSRKMKT